MRILYIDCDSLRPDHLGCYGYHRDTSPTIDAIAAAGRQFENYYVSDAPCLPSRTAFFTDRFGVHTGVTNHLGINADPRNRGECRGTATDGRYRTFPRELRDQGYDTALVSPFPQRHGAFHVLDGFEEWIDTGGDGVERADVVAPEATAWLADNAAGEDWYLHVNFWDPHTPYDTPASFGNPFADDPAPAWLTDERIAEHYASYGPHSARDVHHGYLTGEGPDNLERTPDEIADRDDFRRWVDGYDVGVRYMDEYLGNLLDALREAGVYEETLIVVSADHGENLGEQNVYGDHQTADHPTCRVPLIVAGPGVEPGVDGDLHYHLDLPPALVELAGGDVPAGWDGDSLAPSLTDGVSCGREFLVTGQGAWACQRGVRWEDWLLLCTYHDGWKAFQPVELYDIADDPHETENLARDRPDVVRHGLALLSQWRDARSLDAATGRAGGNPDAPRALVDPLFETIEEGGPAYIRGNRASYTRRLRATGRGGHADEIERRDGVVSTTPEAYLRGQ
ncbi:MAG: sulfatase [Haloarculaceae archaeon]